MKTLKNNLDEMQEQKLLHIEHNGCWLAFWGLLAAMAIQMLLGMDEELKTLAGEWIVFMALCVYMLVACIRAGIWDRHLKAGRKANFLESLIAGVVMAALYFGVSLKNYGDMTTALLTAAILFIFTFIACFIALSFFSALYKKRRDKLNSEAESGEDDSEAK